MRAACARRLAILAVCAASARGIAERRLPDRAPRLLTRARAAPADGASQLRDREQALPSEQAARAIAPAVARALGARVLGAKLSLGPAPVIEQTPAWFDVPDAVAHRRLLPKLLVYPMGFATGGGGLKLSVRF